MWKILKKKTDSKWWNFGKILDFESPFGIAHELCYAIFKQLSFSERLNPSFISKVMVVWSFFAVNFCNSKSMINLYNVRTVQSNLH